MNSKLITSTCVSLTLLIAGCTTSLKVRDGGGSRRSDAVDNVKTLKGPPALPADVEAQDIGVSSSRPSHEELQRQLDVARGEIENLKYQHEQSLKELTDRISSLEEENQKLKASGATVGGAPSVGKNSEETVKLLWDLGLASLSKGDRLRAIDSFKTLADTYPKHALAHSSLLALGMLYYGQQNFKDAAIRFNSAIDRFPRKKNGISLLEFGIAASVHHLGNKEDAKLFFEDLVRKYPKSAAAAQARAVLSKKSKLPEDLFKVFPNWLDLLK